MPNQLPTIRSDGSILYSLHGCVWPCNLQTLSTCCTFPQEIKCLSVTACCAAVPGCKLCYSVSHCSF